MKNNIVQEKTLSIKIENSRLRFRIAQNIPSNLRNAIITKILRRGKYLIFLYSNDFAILFHLGMTGFFRINKTYQKRKHDHLIFNLTDKKLIFNDVRKFGFIKIYPLKKVFQCSHLRSLGPEPLSSEFCKEYFSNFLKRKTTIKNLLMNQNFVAGLGNIYCSEILFKSRVLPSRLVSDINQIEIKRIIKSTKEILLAAIKLGGTTIKNFIVSDQEVGYFKNKLMVYGRENLACTRCGDKNLIKRIYQSGRSSFYCSKCQL